MSNAEAKAEAHEQLTIDREQENEQVSGSTGLFSVLAICISGLHERVKFHLYEAHIHKAHREDQSTTLNKAPAVTIIALRHCL